MGSPPRPGLEIMQWRRVYCPPTPPPPIELTPCNTSLKNVDGEKDELIFFLGEVEARREEGGMPMGMDVALARGGVTGVTASIGSSSDIGDAGTGEVACFVCE